MEQNRKWIQKEIMARLWDLENFDWLESLPKDELP